MPYEFNMQSLKVSLICNYLLQRLGNGEFGEVHLGTWSGPNGSMPVAIKRPKSDSKSYDQEVQRDLLSDEMKIMAYLQEILPNGHENILRLVGAVTKNKEHFCILTEYCEWGSLDNFLRRKIENEKYVDELIPEYSDNSMESTRQIYKVHNYLNLMGRMDTNYGMRRGQSFAINEITNENSSLTLIS